MDRSRVVLAELLRPWGRHGGVLARSTTDVPGRLTNLQAAIVRLRDGVDQAVILERSWQYKELWVLQFAGYDTIEAADRLRGADLWVPAAERATLPSGEYFQSDLIGCRLVRAGGEGLGTVTGWQHYGGTPLLETEVNGAEVLVPFAPDICTQIDLEAREIRVALPEGLLELNGTAEKRS